MKFLFYKTQHMHGTFFLNSISIKKNENVIILDNEYGSNLIGLINKKIKYKICKN